MNERPTVQLATQKQDVYQGIASNLRQDPAVYPLFQGKQWATRLEVAFSALFAALVAGALILLIAITLIVLKLGFLLLLVAGPFFLIIGTHPGFGRVIAIRWFEMLVGVLMKQAAVALTLSVLLYCYALVMAVSDYALPWVFKIMMIALLTVAVFIYRRPFQHLFTSVGYDMVGARERAEAYREQSRYGFRGQTARTGSAVVPGYDTYRADAGHGRTPIRRISRSSSPRASCGRPAAGSGGAGGTGAAGVAGRRVGKGARRAGPAGHLARRRRPGPQRAGPWWVKARWSSTAARPRGGNGNGRREPPPLDLGRRPRTGPPRWQPGPYPPRRGSGSARRGREVRSAGGRRAATAPGSATAGAWPARSAPPRHDQRRRSRGSAGAAAISVGSAASGLGASQVGAGPAAHPPRRAAEPEAGERKTSAGAGSGRSGVTGSGSRDGAESASAETGVRRDRRDSRRPGRLPCPAGHDGRAACRNAHRDARGRSWVRRRPAPPRRGRSRHRRRRPARR